MGFRTIEEIKAANVAARHHFFAPGLMRLRQTLVYHEVYLGRYFITSECNAMLARLPRGFSIREVMPDASIKLVGRFQQFETLEEAKDAIQRVADNRPAGIERQHVSATLQGVADEVTQPYGLTPKAQASSEDDAVKTRETEGLSRQSIEETVTAIKQVLKARQSTARGRSDVPHGADIYEPIPEFLRVDTAPALIP